MRAASEERHPLDGEMQRVYWSPIEIAIEELTFDTEQQVVRRAHLTITSDGDGVDDEH